MALDLEGIHQIAARVAASYGLEIWDVELRGTGGKSRMLRVYIDRPGGGSGQTDGSPAVGGVTHEDCANVSRELGTILDVEDAVPGGTYLLEVSSPGLDRKLAKAADFERFVGSRVKLMTREPIVVPSGGGNRHFEGRLLSAGGGRLVLGIEGQREKGKGKKGKKQRAAGSLPAAGKANHEGTRREHEGEGREAAGEGARATVGEAPALRVEIELSNVERANLVPEI